MNTTSQILFEYGLPKEICKKIVDINSESFGQRIQSLDAKYKKVADIWTYFTSEGMIYIPLLAIMHRENNKLALKNSYSMHNWIYPTKFITRYMLDTYGSREVDILDNIIRKYSAEPVFESGMKPPPMLGWTKTGKRKPPAPRRHARTKYICA